MLGHRLCYSPVLLTPRLAAGTTTSLFIMDTVQKTCLLNIHPAELCNSEIGRLATPTMTSPKKRLPSASVSDQESGAEANSRSTEQVMNVYIVILVSSMCYKL